MFGILKRGWWLGSFIISFAIATVATLQATITIAGAFMHASSIKQFSSQDLQLNTTGNFEERWLPALSTNWQHLTKPISMHD